LRNTDIDEYLRLDVSQLSGTWWQSVGTYGVIRWIQKRQIFTYASGTCTNYNSSLKIDIPFPVQMFLKCISYVLLISVCCFIQLPHGNSDDFFKCESWIFSSIHTVVLMITVS
jgi:hypothetical protein